MNSHEIERADVIIIGAGAAGLGSADYLRKKIPGIKIIVLEARDRIGGRVHTTTFDGKDGNIIDLGAQWIHGLGPGAGDFPDWEGKLNPLYEIALQNNIKTVPCWHLETRKQ